MILRILKFYKSHELSFGQRLLLLSLAFVIANISVTHAAVRNVYKGQAGSLQSIINNANANDIIRFKETGVYWLGNQVITITKPLTFEGVTPTNYNPSAKGATGIRSDLRNAATFIISSNNVQFKNIKISRTDRNNILIDARTQIYKSNFRNPGYNDSGRFNGIVLTNVELNGGFYSVYAGNGITGTFKNVSFINFGRIGYINDRRTRVWGMKKVTFNDCKFQPTPPSGNFGFDSRGISLDAGNTEFPYIWSGDGTVINKCEFINTGVAISRCQGIGIYSSIFKDNNAYVDMIHVEEWSNNIKINGNQFFCNSTRSEKSRIITLDSELQYVHNIEAKNNWISGTYNFFIAGFGTTHLTVTGNNANGANAIGGAVIDLTYYENRYKAGEEIANNQEFVSRNITIKNNPGFGNGNNKNVKVNIPFSGGSIDINNFWGGQRQLTKRADPVPLVGNGVYEIVNAANTSRKLGANGNTVVTKTGNDNSVRWIVTWNAPYYYLIKNKATGKYLETHKGYTEAEIIEGQQSAAQRANVETARPFLQSSNAYKPRWILRKGDSQYPTLFVVKPGGNEKQSSLNMSGTTPKLIFGKYYNQSTGQRSIINHNNNAKWWFNWKSSSREGEDDGVISDEHMSVFPSIASDMLTVTYTSETTPVAEAEIFNMEGQVVSTHQLFSHVDQILNVSDLTSGIYIIKTQTGFTQKFAIK